MIVVKFTDVDVIIGGDSHTLLGPESLNTVRTIYTVLPFKNTLVRLDATGAEIKATLEDAISNVVDPEAKNSGSYPYSGGLRWTVDVTKPKGSRVQNLEIRNASGHYEAFDLTKTYRVITIDFLANGQDGYTTLKSITGDRRMDVGLDYAEAFLTYVQKLPKVNGQIALGKLPIQHYSTQNYIEAK